MPKSFDEGNFSFEKAMKSLEEIVQILEKGEIPLQEAIGLYSKGSYLALDCLEALENAKQKVEILSKEKDKFIKEAFNEEEKCNLKNS